LGRDAPPVLTRLSRKVDLLKGLGLDGVVVCPFDAEFASWSPERFARDLLVGELNAKVVVVGSNFRFGGGRKGDFASLRELGEALGFSAHAPTMASDAKGLYSSTRIRKAIADGDVREAARMLGRPHAVGGTVVHGDKRGRTLGFPTANVGRVEEVLPSNGVYAVRVEGANVGGAARDDGWSVVGDGVMNLGVRPTVTGALEKTCEVHVLEFAPGISPDLYDKAVRVSFVERIRDEKKFASVDELSAQIRADADAARRILVGCNDVG